MKETVLEKVTNRLIENKLSGICPKIRDISENFLTFLFYFENRLISQHFSSEWKPKNKVFEIEIIFTFLDVFQKCMKKMSMLA